MNQKILTIVIATVCLLSVVTIGGVIADDPMNQSDIDAAEGEGGYTLQELRDGGTTYSNSPDSFRVSGDRMYWMIHWPADSAFGSPGDPSDNYWKYLPESGTVERNTIYLRTINAGESESIEVKVVAYETERVDNATVPVNVEERTVQAELESGWAMADINLPQSDDDRDVAVWVVGHEKDLRWHFNHKSVATTQPIAISTMGDYLRQASMDFFFPLFIGIFAAGSMGGFALKRAGVGPRWGYLRWGMLISLIGVMLMWFFFGSLAEIVVSAPRVVAFGLVVLFTIVLIESYSTGVTRAEFLKPEKLDDVMSPSGNEMHDVISWERQEEDIIKVGDRQAVVRPGLFSFLSRCFGGAALIENEAAIETRMSTKGSAVDSLYFASSTASRPLEYEPEGWKINVPNIDLREDFNRIAIWGFIAVVVMGLIATSLSGPWAFAAGLLILGAAVVRPKDGYARIEPATVHERKAYVSMLYKDLEEEDARTISDYEKLIPELKAEARKSKAASIRDQDATLIEEMVGEEGMERTLEEIQKELSKNSSSTQSDESGQEEPEAKEQ